MESYLQLKQVVHRVTTDPLTVKMKWNQIVVEFWNESDKREMKEKRKGSFWAGNISPLVHSCSRGLYIRIATFYFN
jgi:hypothetical protein